MVSLGMVLAAILGLGGLLFLTTAKKEGVSVGAEIGELGKGIGELGLGAGRGIAGAIGTPAFTLIEALRGIFQLGADIQGIPRTEDRAGARPGPVLPPLPGLAPPLQPFRTSGFGVIEVGDLIEYVAESVDRFKQGTVQYKTDGQWRIGGEGWGRSAYESEFKEIQDRLGARAI